MFFLLRASFWLALVLLIIPGDPEAGRDAPRVGIFQAIGAARATVADIAGFCERNPDVCATGSSTFQAMEMKARYGARMLYQYLEGEKEAVPAKEARGTLSKDDLTVPWRGKAGDA